MEAFARRNSRAQLAPAKPPPTTSTRGALAAKSRRERRVTEPLSVNTADRTKSRRDVALASIEVRPASIDARVTPIRAPGRRERHCEDASYPRATNRLARRALRARWRAAWAVLPSTRLALPRRALGDSAARVRERRQDPRSARH